MKREKKERTPKQFKLKAIKPQKIKASVQEPKKDKPKIRKAKTEKIKEPKIKEPKIKGEKPAFPKLAVPKLKMPKLALPKFSKLPKLPKLPLPAISLPKSTKPKSIRTTLLTGFLFPVLMMLVLGIISYVTASNIIQKKYEESSMNTINAISLYADTLASSISARALEQTGSYDLKQYYEAYVTGDEALSEEVRFTHYIEAKEQLLHICNSTSYIHSYYVIPDEGSVMSSKRLANESTAYADFMASDIGKSFTANSAQKNGWFGYHTSIDAALKSTGEEYAFTYVQKLLSKNVYLLFDLSMKSVEEMLQQIDFGKNSICALISPDGREIARVRVDDAENNIILEAPEETIFTSTDFYQKSLETKKANSDYVKWKGDKYLYVYSPIGKSGISLCGLIPQKNIVAEVSTIRLVTILIVAIAAAIAIALGTHLTTGISKTVQVLSNSLDKIAEGDLTQQVEVNRTDEFGTLGQVLNNTIANIRELMENMKQFGGNVNQMADDISEQTDNFNDSIQNISIGIDDVAQGLQAQAEETDRSNSKMQEFAGRLNAIHEETSQMAGAITGATEVIHQGQVIIRDLNEKAQTTASITDVLAENIDGVRTHSHEIEGIIDTINNIADQTNLLSLNAYIEAARAGDQGRGFAVVAEEIRKLAEQSAKAAGEVQTRLNKMAVMTAKTTQSATETKNIVAAQGVALDETITVFGVIEEKVSELVRGLQMIVDGMNQINTDKDEIQTSVQNISMAAETAAASIQEITATLDEQVGVIARLAENMDQMKKETSVLESAMDQFQI